MKKNQVFGVAAAAACGMAFLSGCSTPPVTFSSVEPARKIAKVSAVDVLRIKVNARVSGNLADAASSAEVAGLVRQMASGAFYDAGYIRTADNIWGDSEGAGKVHKYTEDQKSRHGYTGVRTMDGEEKAVLEIDLDLTANSQAKPKTETVVLVRQNYQVIPSKKAGDVPGSKMAGDPIIVKQPVEYTRHETIVTGKLTARLTGPKGGEAPVAYRNEYKVSLSSDPTAGLSRPSLLQVVARAVTPAVQNVVADISPHKGAVVRCDVNKDGDEAVATLVQNKAFVQAVEAVEALAAAKKAKAADWENQGIANEALGDDDSAYDSYGQALKLDAANVAAKTGRKRIDAKREAVKRISASGAKKDASTAHKN